MAPRVSESSGSPGVHSIRTINRHATIETTRTQQRLIQTVRPVVAAITPLPDGYQSHPSQPATGSCLLTLIITVNAGTTLATNRIDFINKDDTRRSLFA